MLLIRIFLLLYLLLVAIADRAVERAAELFSEGNSLFHAGDLKGAIARYRASIKKNPSAPAYGNLGSALQAIGEFKEALDAYENALDMDPDRPMGHYNRGVCLYSIGQLEEALQSFQMTTELDPSYLSAYYNLGVVYQELGDRHAAGQAFAATLQLDAMHEDARLNYCNILGSFEDAVPREDTEVESSNYFPLRGNGWYYYSVAIATCCACTRSLLAPW